MRRGRGGEHRRIPSHAPANGTAQHSTAPRQVTQLRRVTWTTHNTTRRTDESPFRTHCFSRCIFAGSPSPCNNSPIPNSLLRVVKPLKPDETIDVDRDYYLSLEDRR